MLFAMLAGAVPASAADDTPKPLSSRRLFDQSRPGVQLVTVRFSAGLVVPEPVVTRSNGLALEAMAADKIRRGAIPATRTAARGAIIDEMARNPFRWFTETGRVHRSNAKLTATGSGFSITPNGYIVTNAHVVAPKDDDIKAAFLAREFSNDSDEFIADVRQDGLTQSQATKLLGAIVRWSTRMTKLVDYKRTIAVVGSTGSGAKSPSKRRIAKLVDAGEEFPGKDVAVLKVSARNMATVQLGDDTELSTGDRLFVLGFPGPATFNPALSKDSQGEPTLTQGVLSAKKQVNRSYTVLQTDAGMTHGNSGGPVFDEQGRVVGVATLGSVDPNTGREVSGLNFAVPASIVNELLRHAKVTASVGTAGAAYREALDDFDRQWYKRSLPLLQEVKSLDPGHPLAGKLIKDSQTAIDQGRDRTPLEILGLPVLQFAGIAAAIVVVLVGLGVLSLRRRRRRQRQRQRGRAPAPAFEPRPAQDAQGAGWGAQGNAAWGAQAEHPGWGAQAEPPGRASQASGGGAHGAAVGAQSPPGWGAQPGAAQAFGAGTPRAEDENADWWREASPRQPAAEVPPTDPAPPATPAAPAADEGYEYGYGYVNGHNGAGTPPPRRSGRTAAVQSWWNPEEGQTVELPVVRDTEFVEPVEPVEFAEFDEFAEPAAADPVTQPRQPATRPQTTRTVVCENCGRHNHPSLHYCEQCWTVLS